MSRSRHRAIRTLALLLVALLGTMALLPQGALGQNQITGLVSTCVSTTPYVAGATVTLTDVNGINPTRTTTTNGAGVYSFSQPPSGSYVVAANRSGYYNSAPSSPTRFDGSQTVPINLCMYPHGSPAQVLAVTVMSGASPVSGATVAAHNISNPTGLVQLVATGTTNSAGVVNLTLWGAPFQLRTSAVGFQTDESTVDLRLSSTTTISLVGGISFFGHVRDPGGNFLDSGVVAWLYNPAAPLTSAFRLIPATISSSLFDLHAPAGTYTILVDANGHLSHRGTVTLGTTPTPYDVVLLPAPDERYETTVLYGVQDWSNLTAWRNLTLNADSTLTGLVPANLRDLRLQIDATPGIGNGDGTLSAGEVTAFDAWLAAKGPAYVTTDGFLTTNGKAYLSSLPSFLVTVQGLTTPGSKVWINATATYALKQAPPYIATGAKTYFANITMVPDSNVSAYQNYTYVIALPRTYELNTSTTVPASAPVTTTGFTRITVDPAVTGTSPQLRMTVSQSLNGTARAKLVAPVGKFHVENATFTNYRAFAANDTMLTFSAEDSTDPNGHIAESNFTWRFTPSPADVRYGIRPDYKYVQSGEYTVNLTVTEAGGNTTYRDIKVFVDDRLPVASIRTNRTGSGSANGLTLRVDEAILVRFDGGLSTDLAYPGKNGVILDSGYSWDFNGDGISDETGRTINKTFDKPGEFMVNLTVTDSVGWKSSNATMTARVNDTKAPVPAFDILDPSREWAVITSPMEKRTISLNASKTTDNYEQLADLNFTWTIPGPIVGEIGITNHTFWGANVTFAWDEWNNSYNVRLAVRDTGFGSGRPNTGNLSRNITVQIDVLIHADLRIDAGTMKVSPGDPEEGALVTVTVNVTNKAGRAAAVDVTTEMSSITGGQTTVLQPRVEWFDRDMNPKGDNHTILSGETVRLVFTATLSGQGNKTVQVYVYDTTEPYTWRTTENRVSNPVNVRQPWWVPYAIAGSVIGVIVLFVFGMYARRKIKAGEWRPIRGRRGEIDEGGEKRPRKEKEAKEEKKRL